MGDKCFEEFYMLQVFMIIISFVAVKWTGAMLNCSL